MWFISVLDKQGDAILYVSYPLAEICKRSGCGLTLCSRVHFSHLRSCCNKLFLKSCCPGCFTALTALLCANLGDPTALWRTIAYDLAEFHPSLKASVVEFLRRPGFRDGDIVLHFKCLINDVLKKNREELYSCPPVIILDGLDECGSDDSQSAQRQILLNTLSSWTRLPSSFKLLVTSRDERVPDTFHEQRFCRKIMLETGDSVGVETHNDIRTFFEQSFNNIRPMLGMPPAWPTAPELDQLTNRAAGLFIWAKTAAAFMGERRGKPNAKLQLVLEGNLGKRSEDIDTLYRNILDFSFDDSDETTFELFRMVVGAIIFAKMPLHRADLKYFIHRFGREDDGDGWEIDAILYRLSSVIELDGPLRLRHLSFAEFLSDPNRCHEPHHHRPQQAPLGFNSCLPAINECRITVQYLRFGVVLYPEHGCIGFADANIDKYTLSSVVLLSILGGSPF
jgi:hypothetical protein